MDRKPSETLVLTSSWEHLRTSASLVRRYAEQVVVLSIAPALLVQLGALLQPGHKTLGLAIGAAGGLWLLLNTPVLYYFEVAAIRGKAPSIMGAYREGLQHFWRMLGLICITSVLIMLGLLLFIVPGAILLRRYLLAPFYLVDRGLGVRAAMAQSARDSVPAAPYIWATIGVVLLVSLGTAIASQAFRFVPGLPEVITAILSVIVMFMLPLRYLELKKADKKQQ
jgi:hypothetical protein